MNDEARIRGFDHALRHVERADFDGGFRDREFVRTEIVHEGELVILLFFPVTFRAAFIRTFVAVCLRFRRVGFEHIADVLFNFVHFEGKRADGDVGLHDLGGTGRRPVEEVARNLLFERLLCFVKHVNEAEVLCTVLFFEFGNLVLQVVGRPVRVVDIIRTVLPLEDVFDLLRDLLNRHRVGRLEARTRKRERIGRDGGVIAFGGLRSGCGIVFKNKLHVVANFERTEALVLPFALGRFFTVDLVGTFAALDFTVARFVDLPLGIEARNRHRAVVEHVGVRLEAERGICTFALRLEFDIGARNPFAEHNVDAVGEMRAVSDLRERKCAGLS